MNRLDPALRTVSSRPSRTRQNAAVTKVVMTSDGSAGCPCGLPPDPVAGDPGARAIGDDEAEDEPHHRVTDGPPGASGDLRAAAARPGGDDALDAARAAPISYAARASLDAVASRRHVASTTASSSARRRALPRARRRCVRGVADEDHAVAVPVRDARQVVGVVGPELEPAGAHELGRRARRPPSSRLDEQVLPLLWRAGGALIRGDGGAGDVDEPHDVAVGRRVRTEEGARAEDEVPLAGGSISGQRGAAR